MSRQLTAPRRGAIFDRFGMAVAESRESLRVLVVPAYTKNLGRTLDALARIVPLAAADRDRVFRTMRRQSRYLPVLVVEGLTWRQFALLNVLAPQLPGVRTDVGSFRVYNTPEAMAHVVGYVGMAGKGEVDEDPVMRVPGFRLGKTGVEKGFDRPLRGHAGSITSEVDAHGRIVRELGSVPSQPGKDLVLTLDHEVQTIAHDRISTQRRGSLVAFDCTTGDVLVMVSAPSFNPNEIAFKPDPARWAELVKHEDEPLNNRAGRRALSARLDLQSGECARRAHRRCRHAPGAHRLQGRLFLRQPLLPLLEVARTDRAPRCDQIVLRRLFLRDGAQDGHRQAGGDRARARSRPCL